MIPCPACQSESWDSCPVCTDCGAPRTGLRLEHLNPQPGDFLVWRFSTSSKAPNILRAIRYLGARVSKGVHVIAVLGDEKLELMSAEQLAKLGLQRIPK